MRPWPFALAAVAVIATGCSSSPPPAPVAAWTTFSGRDVSFDHPSAWRSYPLNQVVAPVDYVVTYLSTVPMLDTCTTEAGYTSCHAPSPSLLDGGVYVSWIVTEIPQQKLPVDGDDATFDGHAAKVQRDDLRGCQMGAVRAESAIIAAGVDSGPYTADQTLLRMDACIGPGEDVSADLGAVDRMLASLRITS